MIKYIFSKKFLFYFCVILIFVLGLYFRIKTIYNYGFYFDTVYTMYNWAKIIDENGYIPFWQYFEDLSKNYEIDYFDYLPASVGYIYLVYILSKPITNLFNLEPQLGFVLTLKFINLISDLLLILVVYKLLNRIDIKSIPLKIFISSLFFVLPSIWSISVMWGQLDVLIMLVILTLFNRILGEMNDWEYFLWGIVFAVLLNFKVHVLIYLPIIFYILNRDFNQILIKKNIFIWILFIFLIGLMVLFNYLNLQSLSLIVYLLSIVLIIYLYNLKNGSIQFSSGLFIGIISILNIFLNINLTLYANNILGFLTKDDVVSMYAANFWLIFGFISEMPTSDAFILGVNVKILFYVINAIIFLPLAYVVYKLVKSPHPKRKYLIMLIYFVYLIFFLYTSTKMHSRYLIYALIPMTIFSFALYKNSRLLDKFRFAFIVLIISIIHILFFLNQLYVFFDNYSYENTKFLESFNILSLEQISIMLFIAICAFIYFVLSYIKDNYFVCKELQEL